MTLLLIIERDACRIQASPFATPSPAASKVFMLTHIDHVGIAVRSIDAALLLYRDVLGLPFDGLDEVESQGVRVAFLRLGEARLELLEPTRDDSPIAKFIEKRGEGLHHIALATDNLEQAREIAAKAGIRLLSEAPIDGAHGKLITFLHPKDTHGTLVEFCMRNPDASTDHE
ncbi:MAG: methylmalonyl-CoA/ethylmalonyl-CoA epimerase [Bradymonadia bacterium]